MDPEIAKIFFASKAVSTSNGRSYQFLKLSAKPRRTKAEIAEAKLKEAEEKLEVERKLRRLAELEQQMVGQE